VYYYYVFLLILSSSLRFLFTAEFIELHTAVKLYERMEVKLHALLISILAEGEWSASCLSWFAHEEKQQYSLDTTPQKEHETRSFVQNSCSDVLM
jgi:hypothetical protein